MANNLLNSEINRIDFKKNIRQLIILLLLTLSLPLVVYLALKQTIFKGRAAPLSILSLVPQNINQGEDETWQFPFNQEVEVNLTIEVGDSQVESVEALIHYDPQVLSATSIEYPPPLMHDALKCTNVYIHRDESDQEIGLIHIARTAIPLPGCDPSQEDPSATLAPYVPLTANTTQVVATIHFQTLTLSGSSNLKIEYYAENDPNTTIDETKNDSNVAAYQSSGEDSLGGVNNVVFTVVSGTLTPTTSVSPTRELSPTGQCPRKAEGDADCNSQINLFDFTLWLLEYRASQEEGYVLNPQLDFNNSGDVTLFDFTLWLIEYRQEQGIS